jgi:hypothetical protein
MTTWQLWKAMHCQPMHDPIFRRVVTLEDRRGVNWLVLAQNGLIQGQIWFWSLMFVLDTHILIFMVFSGTLYGLIWAVSISGMLATERDLRMYDLLCLTPGGPMGLNWAVSAGCLHRHHTFENINSQESWSIRLILFIPLLVSANMTFGRVLSTNGSIAFFSIFALIVFFYFDHVQSIVLGILFGMLAPQYAGNRFDARVWAFGGFLMVQLATYVPFMLIIFIVLPRVYGALDIRGWCADLSLPVLGLTVLYLSREGIVRKIWRKLADEFNATPSEVESVPCGSG